MIKSVARLTPILLALLAVPVGAAAQHAHEHGRLRLAIAIDGEQLSIALEAPLDSLVGFERAPRTDAERRSAAAPARCRSAVHARRRGTLRGPAGGAGRRPAGARRNGCAGPGTCRH